MPRTVADIMTREVVTLREEDNLVSVSPIMTRLRVRHLPVVDGTKLVGLLTHRDLLRLSLNALDAITQSRDRDAKAQTFVAKVMNRDVRTVGPDVAISIAARQLIDNKFGCLPVVDDEGNLVGIVTEHDFLKELVGAHP